MDRRIIYPAQIPLVEDQLQAARFAGIGIGRIAGALYGESGIGASGFDCTPGSGLVVIVAPGEIIAPGVVDTSTFGVLPASSSALPRQFIMGDPVSVTIPGTGETFIIYGTPTTNDTGNAVLPYFNSANPSQTYAGSANSGTGQPTVRSDCVTVGISTSPPSGSIPLWSVSVPSGATAITNSMISPAHGAPLYPGLVELASLVVAPHNPNLAAAFGGYPQKSIVADPSSTGTFWVSTADNNLTTPGAAGASWADLFAPVRSGRWLGTQIFSASGTYTPSAGTTKIVVTVIGGGGSGGGSPANSSSQISVGSGGASGSFAKVILTTGFSGGVTVTIGSGGKGVANGGNAGSTTTFGSLIAAPGGGFGGTNQITSSTVAGISTTGPSGAIPIVNAGTPLTQSGGSVGTNGQMFGTALVVMPGFGGSSPLGSGGANIAGATGANGTGFGAGGGGTGDITSKSALAGGNGSPGVVIIEEYS